MAIATLGVIVGNRDFFPDHLVTEARQDVVDVFHRLDIDVVMLGEHESKNDVAYSDNPVNVIGISAGVSYGALGSTHHAIHDFAALRAITE